MWKMIDSPRFVPLALVFFSVLFLFVARSVAFTILDQSRPHHRFSVEYDSPLVLCEEDLSFTVVTRITNVSPGKPILLETYSGIYGPKSVVQPHSVNLYFEPTSISETVRIDITPFMEGDYEYRRVGKTFNHSSGFVIPFSVHC